MSDVPASNPQRRRGGRPRTGKRSHTVKLTMHDHELEEFDRLRGGMGAAPFLRSLIRQRREQMSPAASAEQTSDQEEVAAA